MKFGYLVFLSVGFALIINKTFAQAPVISYSPATNVYTTGTTITTITPNNSGGAVTVNTVSTFETNPGNDPYGIAYDPVNGDIITDAFHNGDVFVYSPTGVLLDTYTTDIIAGGPKDLAVDASGNIYVANPLGSDVVKITPSGTFSTITGSPTAMNTPDGLAIDAAGNIYVGDQGTGDIYKIAPGATTATVYASGFTNSYGVTVNSSGQVYVSEFAGTTNSLYTVTSGSTTGGTTLLYSTTSASGSSFRNLSVDASGNIYLADEGLGYIVKIVPGTSQATTTYSNLVTGLSNPRATAFDKNGNMYIANSGGDDIEEYSTSGYSINIPLPTGMSFSTSNGQISGTPTVTSPTTVYTIAAHNASGTGYTTETITVDPTGPTTTGATVCGSGSGSVSGTISATAGTPSGGTFNWWAASTGGTSLGTGATYSPTVSATTTFYVDYTQGGVTCAARSAVTLTVSSDPVISAAPTGGAYFSYGFTTGILTDISGLSNTGTTHGSPTTTNDRYGIANNALSFTSSSSQYISTATLTASPGPQTFSISAWFKTTSTLGGYLVGFGNAQTGASGTVDRVVYMGTNGELYFGVKKGNTTNTTINTASTFNDGNWHHVVATFSATNGSNMYVDGYLAASNPALNSAAQTAGYWRIAYDAITGSWTNAPSSAANTYFNGSLDDIAVANTELTLAQVAVYYGAGSGTFCAGNTLSLSANTVAGATYSWAGPSGSGYTSSSQNPTVPAANAIAGVYVCTVTGGAGCTSTINVTAPANAISYTWSGAANTTNPATAGNWNQLPPFSSTSNLVIPAGLTYYPLLTANESVYGLSIAAGASLGLGGYTLSVGCNIINSAATSASSGILYGTNTASGITWNGSVAAQSYTGTNNTNTASLGNMTVNNSAGGTVTINGGPIDIYNTLTITQGNLAIAATPAVLTLKSSATQSANISAIPSGSSITGLVNVERYLTGNNSSSYRSYRLLSSPVNSNSPTSGTSNYIPFGNLSASKIFSGSTIYGAAIGGPGSGFTITNPHPTMYIYDETLNPTAANQNVSFTSSNNVGISAISGTTVTLSSTASGGGSTINGTTANVPVGNGYLLYFIGTTLNHASGSPSIVPDNATVTNIGYVNQQNVTVTPWFTPAGGSGSVLSYSTGNLNAGLNLVGNPYASIIDLKQVYTDNSTAGYTTFWELVDVNPGQPFVSYNGSTGATSSTTYSSRYVASGQGFFVQATVGGKSLIFKEDQKVYDPTFLNSTSRPSGVLAKKIPVTVLDSIVGSTKAIVNTTAGVLSGLHMMLKQDSVTFDECGIYFSKKWSDNYDNNDASDLDGVDPVVYMSSFTSNGIRTGINSMADYIKGKRVKLYVKATTSGLFSLNLEDIANIDTSAFNIYLVDKKQRDSIDMVRYKTYNFNISTSDTTTFGANRFVLAIERKPLPPYELVSFTGQKVNNGVSLTWKTYNEGDYTGFALQKLDGSGNQYNTLYFLQSNGHGTYTYTDPNPVNGNNTYRLMQNNIDSLITYTNPLNVLYSISTSNTGVMSIYPNPAHEVITVNFNNVNNVNDTYEANIYNSLGALVMQANVSGNSWTQNVSSLKPGAYILTVTSSNGTVIGNSKFIKYQ